MVEPVATAPLVASATFVEVVGAGVGVDDVQFTLCPNQPLDEGMFSESPP